MTETTEKSVLMKCVKCGYQESLPAEDLRTLRQLYNMKPEDEDTVLCPFCLHDMYRIDSPVFKQ